MQIMAGNFLVGSARPTRLRIVLAIYALAVCLCAGAQTAGSDPRSGTATPLPAGASSLQQHHPAGSIQSVEAADLALSETAQVRARIEELYLREQRDCYPKFFTSACLDDAKERRRAAIGSVHAIEVEANSYKRHNRVVERDKALEERRIEDEAKAPDRARLQLEAETRVTARTEAATLAEKNPADSKPLPVADIKGVERAAAKDKAPAGGEVKRKEARPARQIDAATRARNIAAFDKKAADAVAHQQDVATKKAEKDRETQARLAAKAAEASAQTGAK